MNVQELHSLFLQHPSITTDTRNIKKGAIFFALKGANFNGNRYAETALAHGACYAVIDEEEYHVNDKTILVEDALAMLQQLATYHRLRSNAKIISLTGSNGKTTTKELIFEVLRKKYPTVATVGNLNNHIGVPLTLLTIQPETEFAIIEMGANHQKEIAFLCQIAQPDFGYITNFGKAHLEGFGGVEGVIKGKSELYEHLIEHKKSIFLNADDPIQVQKLAAYPHKYGFSSSDSNYYRIQLKEANPFVTLSVEHTTITSKLVGAYNFQNCCAAVIMGKYFNIPLEDIKAAIEHYSPENNRSQIIERDGRYLILDAYNANPTSMKAALESFHLMTHPHKVLILGDMFELGDAAEMEHQAIADFIEGLVFDTVLLVGEHFFRTSSKAKKLKDFESLKVYLDEHPLKDTCAILIKGSRGMALERALTLL